MTIPSVCEPLQVDECFARLRAHGTSGLSPVLAFAGIPIDASMTCRVAVVAAHPDDETIGMGGQLLRIPGVAVVHVTDGAPRERRLWGVPELPSREAYAQVRREELVRALSLCGIHETSLHSLGMADQEASKSLTAATYALADLFEQLCCEIVITHPYEGGHPDHDATSFAVHAACRLLAARTKRPPRVLEFTSYHAGDCGVMAVGSFLPGSDSPELAVVLSDTEQQLKQRMFEAFVTQREVLSRMPIGVERFRAAPRYDFVIPPHPGSLLYERFGWGWGGTEWRAMAADALGNLLRA